jgi:putative two-component system response regulator
MFPCVGVTLLNRVNLQLELTGYRTNALEFIEYQEAISVSIAELVECRDITTGGHLKNTTAYFKLFLEEIISRERYKNLIPEEDVRDLIRSAPLHDIGKIGINDEILRKASTLDYNEFEYMKTHTILGKETFEKIMKETGENRFLLLAKDLAYCHHERWDGTGYPNGLIGESIPFYARILAIADVYDALTSRRTYKEEFSHKDAVEIIRNGRGTLFDPELVDIFIEIKDRFEQAQRNKYRNGA